MLGIDGAHDAEYVLHHQRRQTERRFIQQQQPRTQHQRPRHGEHLLLASGKRAGLLVPPLLQPREIGENPLQILRDRGPILARVGADTQILFRSQVEKGPAAIGHMGNAEPRDILGGDFFDRLSVEADRAAPPQHAADCAQQRGLAGTVGAENGRDASLFHRESHVAQDIRRAVAGTQAGDFQQRHQLPFPR